LLEENDVPTAFFDEEMDLSALRDEYREWLVNTPTESYTPGRHSALQSWDPILVGERFFVAPSWVSDQPPAGRYRLAVDAQSAFGSGRHESTQLMIKAMERVLTSGDVVLDIGCGSGILGSAAEMLGAGTVFACDTSLDALETARVHKSRTAFFLGSADSVRAAAADLILVNISAAVCDVLAVDLARVVRPGGLLLLSGFISEKAPQAYTPQETLEQNGWLCWICSRESIHTKPNLTCPVQPFAEQWW
jgi:ribosomal protein L11 methyltransferase